MTLFANATPTALDWFVRGMALGGVVACLVTGIAIIAF